MKAVPLSFISMEKNMAKPSQLEKLEKKLKKNPQSRLFFPLAEAYRNDGDYEKAIEIYRQGLANHPNYVSARVSLGRALLELGKNDEALAELEQVVDSVPENLMAHKLVAEIYYSKGDFGPAQEQFEAVLLLNPDDNEAKVRLDELNSILSSAAADDSEDDEESDDLDFDVAEAEIETLTDGSTDAEDIFEATPIVTPKKVQSPPEDEFDEDSIEEITDVINKNRLAEMERQKQQQERERSEEDGDDLFFETDSREETPLFQEEVTSDMKQEIESEDSDLFETDTETASEEFNEDIFEVPKEQLSHEGTDADVFGESEPEDLFDLDDGIVERAGEGSIGLEEETLSHENEADQSFPDFGGDESEQRKSAAITDILSASTINQHLSKNKREDKDFLLEEPEGESKESEVDFDLDEKTPDSDMSDSTLNEVDDFISFDVGDDKGEQLKIGEEFAATDEELFETSIEEQKEMDFSESAPETEKEDAFFPLDEVQESDDLSFDIFVDSPETSEAGQVDVVPEGEKEEETPFFEEFSEVDDSESPDFETGPVDEEIPDFDTSGPQESLFEIESEQSSQGEVSVESGPLSDGLDFDIETDSKIDGDTDDVEPVFEFDDAVGENEQDAQNWGELQTETLTMAKIYEDQGHYAEAMKIYADFLKRDPYDSDLQNKIIFLEQKIQNLTSKSKDPGTVQKDQGKKKTSLAPEKAALYIEKLTHWLQHIEAIKEQRGIV